jgi:SWI/SNF related-matrix-associated actin-dependent regulator of chromatin subfamily C
MKDELLVAVVEQSRRAAKRQKVLAEQSHLASPPAAAAITVDWEAVSRRVGHGVRGKDCEREFLALPMVPETDASATAPDRPITPDSSSAVSGGERGGKPDPAPLSGSPGASGVTHQDVLQEILDGCDPDLAQAVTESALQMSGGSLKRAQAAGRAGLVLSQAVEVARSKEESVAHLLSELVDLRMKKLENRLALLDDIEGMLEAERVALDLERRDLYTARCRHWFGGP